MIREGVKYACEACIKGHRVSGCTHADRPLKVIAPKGRPVKQCDHCRVARKSKSHHAKCDCGEKKDKAKPAPKGEVGVDVIGGAHSDLVTVDAHGCCCHKGAKCICGVKVETLDPISETQPLRLQNHAVKTRPGLTSALSESTLTVRASAHHAPSHRYNNSAHTSGAPYRIPRPHSLHSHTPHAEQEESERRRMEATSAHSQRSIDDMHLLQNDPNSPFGFVDNFPGSVESLPITPLNTNFEGGFDPDLLNMDAQRLYHGASQGSIGLDNHEENFLAKTMSNESLLSQPWLWTYPTTTPTPTTGASQTSLETYTTSPTGEFFPGNDSDWVFPPASTGIFGAADLPLNPSQLSGNDSQPISHSGESNHYSAPGLTASSSGARSEADDARMFGDVDHFSQQVHGLPVRVSQGHQELDFSRPQSSPADAGNRHSLDVNLLRRPGNDFLQQELRFEGMTHSTQPFTNTLTTTSTSNTSASASASAPAIPVPLQRAISFPELGTQDIPTSMYSTDYMSPISPTTSGPKSITIPADPSDSEGIGAGNNWNFDLGLGSPMGYTFQPSFYTNGEQSTWM